MTNEELYKLASLSKLCEESKAGNRPTSSSIKNMPGQFNCARDGSVQEYIRSQAHNDVFK